MKKRTKNRPQITPLGDKVLILPLSDEEMGTISPSGIIIPDTVDREKTDRGTVIAVGEGKYDETGRLIPMQVKEGQKIIFQWGDKVEVGGEEYYLVSENNILAVIN
jgi:chaperonin GroES